jgi:hypothetical protein
MGECATSTRRGHVCTLCADPSEGCSLHILQHYTSKSVEQIRGYTWEAARQQLIRLLREQAVQYGLTTLASGTMTDVFVDTSRVMLLCPGLSLIESLLRPLLAHDHVDAVGGPAVGAVPLVTLMARH